MRWIIAILALAGMVAAALALREHYRTEGQAPCSINERWDCGAVNKSRFASIGGVFDQLTNRNACFQTCQTAVRSDPQNSGSRCGHCRIHPSWLAGIDETVAIAGGGSGPCIRFFMLSGLYRKIHSGEMVHLLCDFVGNHFPDYAAITGCAGNELAEDYGMRRQSHMI